MATPDVNNSLKEASLETLRGILSANQDVRKTAESQVQALEVTEGTNYFYLFFYMKLLNVFPL